MTHGDRSSEFLNKPVYNLSLTANDGGGAISINIYLSRSLQPPFSALLTISLFLLKDEQAKKTHFCFLF